MIEGESGLLACYPADERPRYCPAKGEVYFANGSRAQCFSGDKPDQLRGPQFTRAWVDELAKLRYARETWDNLEMAVRLGEDPRIVVTTTPRPLALIRELDLDPDSVVTTGHTLDNRANLPDKTLARLVRRYEGTSKGRQELAGEILEEVEGAIVTRAMIEEGRLADVPEDLGRIVIGIDPASTSGEDADETGIVACGRAGRDGYVLYDVSCRASPLGWARRAVDLYHRLGADLVVAEVNNGGEMVEAVIRQVDANVPTRTVHASRGKHVRFEPVGALYEQGRIHHVGGFPELEDQVVAFTHAGWEGEPEASPDRADAAVWSLTDLLLDEIGSQIFLGGGATA
jgi:phage terminase large subunit-like protein